MTIRLMYALCLLFGGRCMVGIAHVSHYAPELGGVNCQKPCDQDGAGRPIQYGVHAACDRPAYNSRVYMEDIGWRRCWDTGGAIDGFDVDVAIPSSECEWVPYEWEGETRLWCANWRSGERLALWVATRPVEGNEVTRKQWDRFERWAEWARKQGRHAEVWH